MKFKIIQYAILLSFATLASCGHDFTSIPKHDSSFLSENAYLQVAKKHIKKNYPNIPKITSTNVCNYIPPYRLNVKRNALGKLKSSNVFFHHQYLVPCEELSTKSLKSGDHRITRDYISLGNIYLILSNQGNILLSEHFPPQTFLPVLSEGHALSERPQ